MPAVVTRETGRCELEDLGLRPLGPRDVWVRIDASGICHSDLSVFDGSLPVRLPVVLGHEGAGTVLDAGPLVTMVAPGDRVVLAAVAPCGTCWFCARAQPNLCAGARRIGRPPFLDGVAPVPGASGLGTFSDAVVVDERVAVKVATDLPAEQLALLGCAVMTGAGSVFNLARTGPGDAVLVVGAGGVGLAAVQAARVAGAAVIAVADPSAAARAAAEAQGATTTVAGLAPEPAELLALTGGRGFDAVLDCVASAATFGAAWSLVRRGGDLVVIGVPPLTVPVPITVADIALTGRRIVGCVYGGASVHADVARFVALAEGGQLDLAALVGRVVGLDEVPALVAAGLTGPGRTVIVNH